MAIHFSDGFGRLVDKETKEGLFEVKYKLVETEDTKYTNKKWWGEFYTSKEIKDFGAYIIEFDDGRKSECLISLNSETDGG